MQEKKKILLLGGTGAIGIYLAPELLKMGFRVFITSRAEHTSDNPDLVYLKGNAKDSIFLRQLLQEKYDAIVDFMIYSTEEFRQLHSELLDGTWHYLFCSSYRVYGDSQGKPLTEETPRLLDTVCDSHYLSTDEYALTKARQENLLRTSGRNNWTILRPAITYSRERFQLGTMEASDFVKRALDGKTVIFPKQMLNRQATLSWAGDVAGMMARMVLKDETMGQAYTVSTAEHHTWQEILDIYRELLDMQVKIVDLSDYESIMGSPYQIKYDRMLDRIVDNSKALTAAGMRQEDLMPLKEGLKMELAQFRQRPVYHGFLPDRHKLTDRLLFCGSFCFRVICKASHIWVQLRSH